MNKNDPSQHLYNDKNQYSINQVIVFNILSDIIRCSYFIFLFAQNIIDFVAKFCQNAQKGNHRHLSRKNTKQNLLPFNNKSKICVCMGICRVIHTHYIFE